MADDKKDVSRFRMMFDDAKFSMDIGRALTLQHLVKQIPGVPESVFRTINVGQVVSAGDLYFDFADPQQTRWGVIRYAGAPRPENRHIIEVLPGETWEAFSERVVGV